MGIFGFFLFLSLAAADRNVPGEARAAKRCYCDLQLSDGPFPHQQLEQLYSISESCSHRLNVQQFSEPIEIIANIEQKLKELVKRINEFKEEYDGELYSIISFRIIEIEIAELNELLSQLQQKCSQNNDETTDLDIQVQNITSKVDEMEKYDRLKVVKVHRRNVILQRSLTSCQNALLATPTPYVSPQPGSCSFGRLKAVSYPKSSMLNHYGTSYNYGSWGKDPLPAPGKEDQYWLVILSNSNRYGTKIRVFNSYSKFLSKSGHNDVTFQTHNPQGSGGIMYGDAYYYNCFNLGKLCRFNMTTHAVISATLPFAGYNDKFPYCTLSSCYGYTDMDLATDENGLWVLYSTEFNFGNLVVSQLNATDLSLLKSWNTTLFKRSVTNAFLVCGVVYATRYINSEIEEIFYMFDTTSGVERNDLNIQFRKVLPGIQYMNYNPQDRKLYVYSDAFVVSYSLTFE
ncbi:olfactomedin-4-like [Carcharodon carcharias]|uniref:olfactomedin-4-like n=1 Tax=Carcharodon carcharias TaxID=13397 RepID=UPI001B7DABC9|nr:olfactomedin-4-like [Carcharodon carcharias]